MTDFLAQFRTRRLLCQTLLDLSQQQRQGLLAGNYETVVDVLQRKDRVISRLVEGHATVDAWRVERDALEASVRSECDRLLTFCDDALKQLQSFDESDAQVLLERRSATQDLLKRIAAGQHTHDQYQAEHAAPTGPPRLNLAS